MPLNIVAREPQGITVLDLSGRIVAGEECDSLRSKIKELLASSNPRVLLNFSDVSRVDSTGIGMLVETVILAAKGGGELKLENLPRLIYNTLYTHRLLPVFEIFENEEQALASFGKQAQPFSG